MVKVAIMGHGTVGSGVYEVFEMNAEKIARTVGEPVEVKYVLDLRDFSSLPYGHKFVTDFSVIENDPEVTVVAEVMGGVGAAYQFTKRCLEAGKSVCTSNKELVATKGDELLKIAEEHGVNYMFEASVGGGIPIIRPMLQCLAANEFNQICGILNGTTNYILTQMIHNGVTFADALKQAQLNGYAEKDPTADIEGHDACRKTCILAALSFGQHVYPDQVPTQGIRGVSLADVAYADSCGYKIKLLGRAIREPEGKVCAFVAPHLVSCENPLAGVEDVFNAIAVTGNAVGDVMFYGRGAGKLPTASAVVADVIDEVKHLKARKYQFWEPGSEDYVVDYRKGETAMLLRLHCTDAEAAFAQAQQLFGEVQRLHADGETAQDLAFVTPVMPEEGIDEQIAAFTDAKVVSRIRVADF